jgi:hypothetical protein
VEEYYPGYAETPDRKRKSRLLPVTRNHFNAVEIIGALLVGGPGDVWQKRFYVIAKQEGIDRFSFKWIMPIQYA